MQQRQSSTSLHQRLALGLFVVIGMATFVLGAVRLSKAIGDPLRLAGGGAGFQSAEETERENNERLRAQDTDNDGLNDYDELYVFRTSPFLEDTDSDGEGDGKEVASENDPNCPKGRTCRTERVVAADAGVGTTLAVNAPTSGGTIPATTDGLETPQIAEQAEIAAAIRQYIGDPDTLTAAQITDGIAALSSTDLRAFIIRLGIPQSVLDKTDDQTLRLLLNDTLKEMTNQ